MRFDIRRKTWEWFWWLEPKGARVRFTLQDGVVTVHAPDGSLEILLEERWPAYKRGIRHRLSRLARGYGVPEYVALRPGNFVIDVGANIGEFSLFASNAGANAIAIEPDPFTLDRLNSNTSGRNIEILAKCLWESCGLLRFNISPHDADGSLINPSDVWREIYVETLDHVLAGRDIKRIRLIKADVEGAEPEFLRGATKTLKVTEYVTMDCGSERRGEKKFLKLAKRF